jgi:hypothetical protein
VQALLSILVLTIVVGCSDSKTVECGPPIFDLDECLDFGGSAGERIVLCCSIRLPPEDERVCIEAKALCSCEWEQVAGPVVEILRDDLANLYFIPTKPGDYVFRFRVMCPGWEGQWDVVTFSVPGICGPPFSEAGHDQVLATSPGDPQTVHLDGTKSYTVRQDGCDLHLLRYTWTALSVPAGAAVPITDNDQAEASAVLSFVGDYVFQLEVQDDGGTYERTDTAADTVTVTLVEKESCGVDLEVAAINAATGEALAGVLVTVVDALGDYHTATTGVLGVAVFDSLADGERQSITAVCDELVPPVGGVGGEDRPRFETTTVMNHCAGRITIPMRYTASGKSVGEWGTVVAKVPATVFDMLPHSWICAGECSSDADCDERYYCELDEDTPCGPNPPEVPKGTCTPRSIMSVFNMSGRDISGQIRFVMVLPVLPIGTQVRDISGVLHTRPAAEESLWPGNFATDDSFFDGLAPALGLDP